MPKFIISQTIDLDLQWVIEAEDVEDAMQKATGRSCDKTKIINVDHLTWDQPYDACPIPEDYNKFTYLNDEQLLVYINAGIL
jgi:hypothetical protein